MFNTTNLLFYYCTSPVHMGAGTAVGAIDNPIQREVHTEHPVFAGSGIKGAARHHLTNAWKKDDDKAEPPLIKGLFGPDGKKGDPDHAGAISFTDAQLVAFPVRCLKQSFVYATSPTALARLRRLAASAGINADWTIPTPAPEQALLSSDTPKTGEHLILEAFKFSAEESRDTQTIAEWIAQNALPDDDIHGFFRQRIRDNLVILPEDAFSHFVRHATVVEPHVRIDNETGAADGGGLFYTENLPPESILAGLLMAGSERKKEPGFNASQATEYLLHGPEDKAGLHARLLQLGGDATTGRGLVQINAVEKGE